MNDEIKEIKINTLNQLLDFVETEEKAKLLIDYTTNLQEKYDKALTDLVHESHKRIELENKITNLQQENERLKIQVSAREELYEYSQSKIEKAVEYIENEDIDVCTIKYNDIYDTKQELLNILNGRSDE